LLRLVSPAVRIEPGLLRAVRLLLPAAQADAGTELDAWQHPAVIGAAAAGATLDPQSAARLRADFADEPPELQRQVLALLRVWRKHAPQELWFEEILSLAPRSRALLPAAGDLELAERFFRQLSQQARAVLPGGVPGAALAWYRRCERRLPEHAWSAGGVGEALQRLSWAVHAQEPGYQPPPGFDPAFAPAGAVRHLELCQSADCLEVTLVGGMTAGRAGRSLLGRIESGSGLVQVLPLDDLPPWADRRGTDAYGDWIEFSVPDPTGSRVVQRLRWIAPGTFLMGSPEDEPGRYSDEGPRHQVTIGDGFWLFDTPCTQALWTAVMGANPSGFQSPGRPVEQVSWEDVQGFIARLNGLVPGLDLTLPTEAQWEYACRAGTDSALYTGPIEILGERNAPALDPIAWYGGNSGVGFELANGWDSSEWKEQQYPNPKSGTHPVGEKQPNPWGLYDMLGNVYEWVEDHWHDDYSSAPTDGSAWLDAAGAARVVRGGSWLNVARFCRCASRSRVAPAVRVDDLGFRCARVQVREPGGQEGAGGSGADFGGSEPLRLDSAAPAAVTLPDAPAVEVRTERAILTLRRTPRPAWASAMGRDRFGLWAEIAIAPDAGGQPVIQRLRWCPPGRFLMGSPDDEPGRRRAEGPRHPVTLGAGYWLFDTPCTQALWEALMGENPSTFKTPDRPVEGASWEDAQSFVAALNRRLAHLGDADERFVLPSESRWEYACRAGSDAALYTGPIEILGDANAPALDPIAWYGGNSNVDFELDNGLERSWLKDLQYPGGKAGIHPVKGKRPNDWGFYDMLGNVWEWLEDAWHDGYDGAPPDGSAWPSDDAGAGRVIRGGSWDGNARDCRCACRGQDAPGSRYGLLGFRCARVQVSEPVGPAAERAGPAAARPAVADQAGRRQVRRAEPEPAGLWGRLKGWFGGSESP
jgi:formylglycine-generating enzyme required for sulfatase activity